MDTKQQVLQALADNTLTLPRIPGKIAAITQVLHDPDSSTSQIVAALSADVSVSARVMQVANSAWFWSDTKVSTLQLAVIRLGVNALSSLVLGFGLRDTFTSSSPEYGKYLGEVWNDSTRVASLSFLLAKVTRSLHKETAFLIGLLHKIGHLPVTQFVYKNHAGSSIEDVMRECEAVGCSLSGYILHNWNMPSEIVEAVDVNCRPYEVDPLSIGYGDLLILASRYVVGMDKESFNHLPSAVHTGITFERITTILSENSDVWQNINSLFFSKE